MVEVFMDTVEQPEKELLGIVLGISPVLHGTPGHSILPQHTHTEYLSSFEQDMNASNLQKQDQIWKTYIQCWQLCFLGIHVCVFLTI